MNGGGSNDLLSKLKSFLPEFDPDRGCQDVSSDDLDLSGHWRVFASAFDDLCRIHHVSEDKKRILVLLAGVRLRTRLEAAGIRSDDDGLDYDGFVEAVANYFAAKSFSVQQHRFQLFYGDDSRRFPEETADKWRLRLLTMASRCGLETMSLDETVALIMSRDIPEPTLRDAALKLNTVEAFFDAQDVDEEAPYEDDAVIPVDVQLETEEEEEVDSSSTLTPGPQTPTVTIESIPRTKPRSRPSPSVTVTSSSTCPCLTCRVGDFSAPRHACPEPGCEKAYTKSSHLRSHMGSHADVLPFGCQWCPKRFYRSDQLARHSRTHTGEKRFKCNVCGKAFGRSDHLNKHVKTHETASSPMLPLIPSNALGLKDE